MKLKIFVFLSGRQDVIIVQSKSRCIRRCDVMPDSAAQRYNDVTYHRVVIGICEAFDFNFE